MQLNKIILVTSNVPVVATAVYAYIHFRRFHNALRIFAWFIFLSCAVQLTSLVLWYFNVNNMPVLHFYVATGFLCLAWFYSTLLKGFINHRVIIFIAGFFTVFTSINSVFIQTIYTFNSYALTLESILVLIFSLSTYLLFLNEVVKEKIIAAELSSYHWINSGLFIYYASSLLIFYLGDVIMQRFSVNFNQYTWVLHAFFTVFMYLCILIGLWKRPKG